MSVCVRTRMIIRMVRVMRSSKRRVGSCPCNKNGEATGGKGNSLGLPLFLFSGITLRILPLMVLLRYRSDRLHDLLILESLHLLPHRPTVLVIRVVILALCIAVLVVLIVRSTHQIITDSYRATEERGVRGAPAGHEQDHHRALSDSTCVTPIKHEYCAHSNSDGNIRVHS